MGNCASAEDGMDPDRGGGGRSWGDGPVRLSQVELLRDLSDAGGAGDAIGGAGFSGGGAAQFLSATPAGGGWLLVALAEVRRLEDTVLAYRDGRLVGRLLLKRPEELGT